MLMIGWLLGIAGQSIFGLRGVVAIGMIVLCVIGIVVWKQKRLAVWLMLIAGLAGFGFSALRVHHTRAGEIDEWVGNTVTIRGKVASEPATKESSQTIQILAQSTEGPGAKVVPSTGKIIAKLPLWPLFQYGDRVVVSCLLERPEPIEDFAYDKYLALSQVYAICQRPDVITAESGNASLLRSLYAGKRFMIEKIQSVLGEPHAGLLAGLLVGARQGLPEWLTEQFRRTGVSHIVAISGYNITIIATIVFQLTQRWVGRRRSFWLVLLGLSVFALLTGAQASVIRATLMGMLVVAAKQLGRAAEVTNVLLFAGCLMVLPQPLTLGYDVGFQLSFLATAGLVYVTPWLTPWLGWVPERLSLRDSLASTLAATISTLPLIIWQFGQVSLIAVIVNILVLPTIPVIMGLGALAVLGAALWQPIGLLLAWPVWLGLSYVLNVVHVGDRVPWAAVAVPNGYAAASLAILGAISILRLRIFRVKTTHQ